jgi:hypothetical protein
MIFRIARPGAAFAVLLIAGVGAGAARAAEKNDDDTPVSVLIGDAVAEYDAGHYQEARALFRQAHDKSPTARTLRGIGMCSFEMRDYVEATRALAASLRDQRRPLTSEQKRHAEALLARAHTFIGRFTVHVKPADASLFVDGHPAELEPDGVLLLPFGRHQLSLRCASCAPAEKQEDVDVSGGEHKDLELALAPAPPPGPPAVTDNNTSGAGAGGAAAGGGTTPGGEADTSSGRGHAHLWFTGAAVAAALGAGGSALWWRDQQHQLDLCAQAGNRCTSGQSTVEDRRKIAIGMTIGLGAAAVGSGIAAALLWPHAEQPAGASGMICVPGDKMVSCAIRF